LANHSKTIILLTLVFPPDGVSTSVLMGELVEELTERGLAFTVLTTTPHYNNDPTARQKQPLTRRWAGIFFTSWFGKTAVYHASVSPKGSRILTRLWDYLRFHIVTLLIGMSLPRPQVILAPSPPLSVGIVAWCLALWHRVPFVYNVQEIYPDVAVQLGMVKNRQMIKLLHLLESFVYARAQQIVVISDWFRQNLLAKGVPAHKLTVIPNFVDTDFITPQNKDTSFALANQLADKFVVLYAGNLGLTQNFEIILSVAKRLESTPDILFLLVGDGARKEWLNSQLASNHYPNVTLLPYLPREQVPALYASSDVCLVPLKGGTANQTFPSKIYTIMAAGRPVIATADPNTELHWVVETANCGWAIQPDAPEDLYQAVRSAYQLAMHRKQLGENGRAYVTAHHTRQKVGELYASLLNPYLHRA
jgi:colanic acid biosynthesis glycosyl transferase WcaI